MIIIGKFGPHTFLPVSQMLALVRLFLDYRSERLQWYAKGIVRYCDEEEDEEEEEEEMKEEEEVVSFYSGNKETQSHKLVPD